MKKLFVVLVVLLFTISSAQAYILNDKADPSEVEIGTQATVKIDISAPFEGENQDIIFSKQGITIQSFEVEGNNLILDISISETAEPGDVTIQIDNTKWGEGCCTLSNAFTLIAKAESQVYPEKEKDIVKDVEEVIEEDNEPTDANTETKIAKSSSVVYSIKIFGIDVRNFGFLDVVNWLLDQFRSKDNDGDNPRDTPPPTVYGEEIDDEKEICGPDVTNKVLDTLQRMQERYDSWSSEEREEKCNLLTDPTPSLVWDWPPITFDSIGAWDIGPLSPAAANTGGFKNFARACAKPDWPCNITVEFIEECVHFQVLNYIQWGAMSSLCTKDFPQHQTKANNAHALYGGLKWAGGLSDANLQGQVVMSLLGRQLMASLNTWNTHPEFYNHDKDEWRKRTKERLKERLKDILDDPEFSDWKDNRPELICLLECELSEGEKNFWEDWEWEYQWGNHDGV